MPAFYHSGRVATGHCLQQSNTAREKLHLLLVQLLVADHVRWLYGDGAIIAG